MQNTRPNLRSWLTGIDCPLFKETLRYQDGTTPQWGGNISEMSWGPGTVAKNYRFGYDALSRLVSADYSEDSDTASANARVGGLIGGGGIIGGEIVSEGHSESYHYDRNGNMDLHGRDNLMEMIGIEGNRITSVGSKTISYDAKGRQISSTYGKSVATQYNILDLPQKHTVGNGTVVVDYRYAADGRKLQEKVSQGSSQTSRDYIGEFIYENGTLKKILFDGGYVDMIGDSPVYMFFIKDHLGSVRAVVSEKGEVLQTNEFYPYGDLFSSAGTADSSGNRYRFTGKELGDEIGLYDFSARYLQTSLGRFTTIDPLAEKYPSVSPYAYCNGNPVNLVDPDGRAIGTVTGLVLGAIFGGISARKNDEKVLKGIVSGAVSGVITGLTADLIAASGGSLALVLGGAVASGAFGGMYGELLGSMAVGEEPATSDLVEATQEGAVLGAISGFLGIGSKAVKDAAKAPLKGAISTADDVKLALPNASDEVVSEVLERTNQAQSKAQTRVKSTNKIYDAYTNLIQYIYTLYEKDDE